MRINQEDACETASGAINSEAFLVIPGALNASKNEPPGSDSPSEPGLRPAIQSRIVGSENAFEHSVPNLQRIMSAELTKTIDGDPLLEPIFHVAKRPVPSLSAKTVNPSIYLPVVWLRAESIPSTIPPESAASETKAKRITHAVRWMMLAGFPYTFLIAQNKQEEGICLVWDGWEKSTVTSQVLRQVEDEHTFFRSTQGERYLLKK